MRKFTFLLLSVAIFFNVKAQIKSDTVSMGPGYTNDVYYSLENGHVSEYSGSEWTVAFYNSATSAAIMINEGREVELWIASEDTADFGTIDTAGMDSWTKLHDSELSWSYGSAFEDESIPGNSNYGWGNYNFSNHRITGSRVFLIKTVGNNYYKVLVENKITGIFSYRYASLDNSLDTTISINTADLVGKNYTYLNMDNHSILDREPPRTDWDILFTKYWDLYNGGFGASAYAAVTGVLINQNVGVVEVRNVPSADAEYVNQAFDTVKNIIGYDFKYLNTNFEWALEDSLSYLVKSNNGDIYHLYFTRFDGTSTGIIGFNVKKLETTTAIKENDIINIHTLYPNPSNGVSQLVFSSEKNTITELGIYNLLGELIYNTNIQTTKGLNAYPINLNDTTNGVYLIQLKEGNKIATQKLVINR